MPERTNIRFTYKLKIFFSLLFVVALTFSNTFITILLHTPISTKLEMPIDADTDGEDKKEKEEKRECEQKLYAYDLRLWSNNEDLRTVALHLERYNLGVGFAETPTPPPEF